MLIASDIDKISRIARDLRGLKDRFKKYEARDCPSHERAVDVCDAMIQGGRLVIEAIDAGAFPRQLSRQNGNWWDRSLARIPGGPLTVWRGIPEELLIEASIGGRRFMVKSDPEVVADLTERLHADAMALSEGSQFCMCWIQTICWLGQSFPSRIRHRAHSQFFMHAAVDEEGRPLGMDGKPLERIESDDGWRYADKIANVEDFYTEEDWQARHRRRAEACADACKLLAELIDEGVRKLRQYPIAVDYARLAAARVGRSVGGLLAWAHTAREAGRILQPDDPEANVDAEGTVWRIVMDHVTRATGLSTDDLGNLALYISAGATAARPDLRALLDQLHAKVSLAENEGLFDRIAAQLRADCAVIARDALDSRFSSSSISGTTMQS